MTVHKFESSRKTTVEINEYKHIKRKNMKNNPQKKILRQDGFPIGAEMAKKRYSSAGTTTPFLKQLILTILLFAILPVTALAAGEDAPGTLYVGQTQITGSGYWKTNSDGTLTTEGANNDNYNVYYDGNSTLTLKDAKISGSFHQYNNPFTAGIYAKGSSNQSVSLTIDLIGENTITGNHGIFVNAEIGTSIFGADASLTITGKGSLEVSGFDHGIYVKSGTGDASLNINDASVVAKATYGVTEEPATAIERVETLRIYAAEGILHVETPTRQRVTIVSMGGALIADGEQEGARIYRDLNAGVYIVRVGDYATKVRVE